MIWSIVAVAIGGALLLVSYTYASPGIAQTLESPTPILSIIDYQWGATAKEIINVVFLISFFAVSMLILAGAVRLLLQPVARQHGARLRGSSGALARGSTRRTRRPSA